MKYEKDKITVIIPVYNVENYLERCLKSILYNTYTNLEIICVNDGSTDNTQKVIDSYAANYNWILAIQQKNEGQSEARNRGIDLAKGKYIVFVDSDDYVAKDYLCRLKKEIKTQDMVCCGAYQVSEDEQQLLNKEISLQLDLSGKNVIMPGAVWGKIYKRDIIQRYNLRFKSGVYFEDALFNIEYFAVAESMKTIDYYGYFQRINSQSSFGMINKFGISDSKIPYDGLKEVLSFCTSYINKKEEIEFLVIRFFTVFIFDFSRGASIQTVKHVNEWIDETLNLFYPQYYKNKYISLFSQRGIPFIQRLAVIFFVILQRTHLLKPISIIFTRRFFKKIIRTRYEN